ncbi:MAG: hypothetical protein NWE83_09025 [Candidatus Bathyarchaeota archaeon]|nr:hypothetical protein [Candidatus Bathyarchaeota archaeon]
MKTQPRSLVMLGVCLLVLCIVPLPFAIFAAAQDSEVPGVPDDAIHYDRMGMTPDRQMEQIMAGTMHVYRYQHVTMLMNCSQNMVMNMTSDAQVRNRITGLNIEVDQPFRLSVHMMTEPPTGIQTMQRTLNTYWGLEPNATLQLRVQLRLHINESALNTEMGRQVNREQLRWMYWDQTRNQWEAVESSIDADGYLVCETDHLSTWTVAEVESTGLFDISTELLIAVVCIGVIAVAGVVIVMRRR